MYATVSNTPPKGTVKGMVPRVMFPLASWSSHRVNVSLSMLTVTFNLNIETHSPLIASKCLLWRQMASLRHTTTDGWGLCSKLSEEQVLENSSVFCFNKICTHMKRWFNSEQIKGHLNQGTFFTMFSSSLQLPCGQTTRLDSKGVLKMSWRQGTAVETISPGGRLHCHHLHKT